MPIQTLEQMKDSCNVALVRVDYNVPMEQNRILDSSRIDESLPTLKMLQKKGLKIVLLSHRGRPQGKVEEGLTLEPIAKALQEKITSSSIYFSKDLTGDTPHSIIQTMNPGDILLLENLRFYKGEESNDLEFAKKLALLGDCYINDAFSVSHRAHASIEAITHVLPSYMGKLMEKELHCLEGILYKPSRPLMAIVGGAKISSKIGLLESLSKQVDTLAIMGGMANTFLEAQGYPVGTSLVEREKKEDAQRILMNLKEMGCEVILPVDAMIASKLEKGTPFSSISVTEIPSNQMILDVGPETIKNLEKAISRSKTLVWNGALGVTEVPPFDHGTTHIMRYVAQQTK